MSDMSDHHQTEKVFKGVTESDMSSQIDPLQGKFWQSSTAERMVNGNKSKKTVEPLFPDTFVWTPYTKTMDGRCKSQLDVRAGSGKPAPFTELQRQIDAVWVNLCSLAKFTCNNDDNKALKGGRDRSVKTLRVTCRPKLSNFMRR